MTAGFFLIVIIQILYGGRFHIDLAAKDFTGFRCTAINTARVLLRVGITHRSIRLGACQVAQHTVKQANRPPAAAGRDSTFIIHGANI